MENIVCGTIRYLETLEGVTDVKMIKKSPCVPSTLSQWETKHQVQLPRDLKAFYLLTNGIEFSWNSNVLKLVKMGKIDISKIEDLVESRFCGYPDNVTKAFVIEDTPHGSICLAYLANTTQIWFYSRAEQWDYLCDTFSAYFRLSFSCFGIFGWQMGYTIYGFTNWTMNWMYFYAPDMAMKIQKYHAKRTLPYKEYSNPKPQPIPYQHEKILE